MFIFNKLIYVLIFIVLLFINTNVIAQTLTSQPNSNPDISKVALKNLYQDSKHQFSIKYPDDWIVEDSGKNSVVFSGKKGDLSFFSSIHIQTLTRNNQYKLVKDVMADIKNQVLKESPKTTFLNQGNLELTMPSGLKYAGEYLIFIYSYEGHIIEQWQIVVARKDQAGFYAWSYTSPLNHYSKYLDIAKAMLASWVID